jgi:hypothetical protein
MSAMAGFWILSEDTTGFWDWLAGAILANPLLVLLVIALGPIVIVAFARNSVASVLVMFGTVIGLVLAVTSDEILLALGLFGLGLWLIAIGFVIGRLRREVP